MLPSVFALIGASDAQLQAGLVAGFIAAGLLLVPPLHSLGALCFALIYASFTTVAQPWMGLQFEPLLVETNIIVGSGLLFAPQLPWMYVYMLRWLCFRLMLAAGAGKLASGDSTWRDGTAMCYHYETQPCPNPLSRFMHLLPRAWHQLETFATYCCFEGPLALTFFSESPVLRWMGFVGTAMFNLAIGLTGNYGHLHVLTIAIALSLLIETGDMPMVATGGACPCSTIATLATWGWTGLGLLLGAGYVIVSAVPFAYSFQGLVTLKVAIPGWRHAEWAFAELQRYHVVGMYSLFSNMTTFRWELQLEGTADGGATWYPYRYQTKPGGPPASLNDAPPLLPPGHLNRVDWRTWFLPLALQRLLQLGLHPCDVQLDSWYDKLVGKVLEGSPDVCALLVVPDALRGARLDAVRTLVYDYRFSDGSRTMLEDGTSVPTRSLSRAAFGGARWWHTRVLATTVFHQCWSLGRWACRIALRGARAATRCLICTARLRVVHRVGELLVSLAVRRTFGWAIGGRVMGALSGACRTIARRAGVPQAAAGDNVDPPMRQPAPQLQSKSIPTVPAASLGQSEGGPLGACTSDPGRRRTPPLRDAGSTVPHSIRDMRALLRRAVPLTSVRARGGAASEQAAAGEDEPPTPGESAAQLPLPSVVPKRVAASPGRLPPQASSTGGGRGVVAYGAPPLSSGGRGVKGTQFSGGEQAAGEATAELKAAASSGAAGQPASTPASVSDGQMQGPTAQSAAPSGAQLERHGAHAERVTMRMADLDRGLPEVNREEEGTVWKRRYLLCYQVAVGRHVDIL